MSTSCGAIRAGHSADAPAPRLDRLAIGASFACFAHCVLLPMLIAASPALADVLDVPEQFHLYAFVTAVPISALAMARGFRRHGMWLPMGLGLAGLALLGLGTLADLPGLYETGLTLSGSLILAGAHIRNWQLRAARFARSPVIDGASAALLTSIQK